PRRLRVPLVGELEPEDRRVPRRDEREARVAPYLDTLGTIQGDRDVDLAGLQHRQARVHVGDGLHHELLYVGRAAPVARVRLQHHLHARHVAHELVGAGADRMLTKALLANLREVFLRDDDADARGGRAVERHEVRPGLLEPEAHRERVDDVDLTHARLEFLGAGSLVALEAELHILGGEGIAIVDLSPRRSLNSYTSPSGLSVHDSARLAPIFWFGIGRATASWIA